MEKKVFDIGEEFQVGWINIKDRPPPEMKEVKFFTGESVIFVKIEKS